MDWASVQIAVVLLLVAVVFFGFVRERQPPDIVALSAVGLLLALGILETDDVLGVFSNSAPVTVGALFVLSAALERTGVVDSIGRLVYRAAGMSPLAALGAMLAGVMVLSAFINNTPVVVILTPVAIQLAQALGQKPSKLLIPLSFAAIFGGTTTLIGTSTNILVDGVAQQRGLAPFGMFEITVAGVAMAAVGIAYLLLLGRFLLPDRDTLAALLPSPSSRHFLTEVLVPLDSPLIGRRLREAGFREEHGLRVIDVVRGERSLRRELADVVLRAGDRLILRSKVRDIVGLRETSDVIFGGRESSHAIEPIAARETVVIEGMVGPESRLIGRGAAGLGFRRLYGAYILAIYREGEGHAENFDRLNLQMGDTLLLEASPESMRRLFEHQDLINLVEPSDKPLRRGKAPIAVAAVLLVMGLAAFEVLPIAALALIAATAVVALRCLEADEAYRSIHWNILMLIFAMLGLGAALDKSGAARLIVDLFAALVAGLGPVAVLSAVYLVTSILTEVMSNNAVAILLTPIAIALAEQLGVDPRPFVVAVMFAASASFATPIGYQTNTFVYKAGSYRFTDFIRVGLPLNLLYWAAATLIIPVFWPLH